MSDIPEHLKKRAQAAKAKAEAKTQAPAEGSVDTDDGSEAAAAASGIPAHLLNRSKKAKNKGAGADSTSSVAARTANSPAGGGVAAAPSPTMTGPGGHTQRLLTVVKAGSIQDIKSKPLDKVHTWPHLIVVEFGAMLAITAFLLVFSVFVNAPLGPLADVNLTPNPSKAPWYFLGLQELLTLFHPMVAGVTIPGIGIIGLALSPYIDKTVGNKPESRKFAVSIFTIFLMFWAILSIIGSFFRGPGFLFVFPWEEGIFFEL